MCGEAELWLRTAYPLLHQEYKQSTPSSPSMTSSSSTMCLICLLRPHSGLHYGLHTCEGDKQFLKRTFHERIVYSRCLEEEGICPPRPRGWCQYCRLRRCLVSGVNLSLVRVGEARVRRGTKRTREQALSLSRNQVPPMYVPQPQQMMYHQPYQVFVKNQTDTFWLRPPGNPFPFFPPSSSAYLSSNLMAVSDARFPARTAFEPMTAGPRALQPHHRPWYVSPPRQSLPEKEPGHSEQWYMEEFANFMHLRKNEQNMGELKRPNVESTVGMLSESQIPEYPQVSAEAYYVNAESVQSHEATSIVDPGNPCLELSRPFTITEFTDAHQERLSFPKLDLINEGEVSTMKQNYVSQGEYSHGQEINKIERFKRHDSILSEEELARPPRTSSEKSYKEESSQLEEIVQPIDLSSLCSPLDLSSVSSPIDLSSSSLPRPASVESFGPPRPLSTGSTGVSRPSSAGGFSRPPSLPGIVEMREQGILEMSGNNKFSVNSAVLQDALEKVNISVANFANISNLSGVLEASI